MIANRRYYNEDTTPTPPPQDVTDVPDVPDVEELNEKIKRLETQLEAAQQMLALFAPNRNIEDEAKKQETERVDKLIKIYRSMKI